MGSIIAGNEIDCQVNYGSVGSDGNNIFGSECLTTYSGTWSPKATDKIGVDPQLGPLSKLRFHALAASSPAVDAFDGPCPATDIRGVSRPAGSRCDIGSFEYTPPGQAQAVEVLTGSGQSAPVGEVFWFPLVLQVVDAQERPVPDVEVTLTSPTDGPGLLFSNQSSTITIQTNGSGAVTVSGIRANETAGAYQVTASIGGSAADVTFDLANDGAYRYVDGPNGNDKLSNGSTNNCADISTPCLTLTNALTAAQPWETIRITSGTYSPSSLNLFSSTKSLHLSGGWNSTFNSRNGYTIFSTTDNNSTWIGVNEGIYVTIDHISLAGRSIGISNRGSLIYRNAAIHGTRTAIQNEGKLKLENVTLAQNEVGLYNLNGGNAFLLHSTIAEQVNGKRSPYSASPGINNSSGRVTLQSSIVAKNSTLDRFDCSGKIDSLGHNLVSIIDGCDFTPAEGDITGTVARPARPRLSEMDSTFAFPLLPGSPAIDAANPSTCLKTDERGNPRPDGAGCDMGAYEGTFDGRPPADAITFRAVSEYALPGSEECKTPTTSCTNGSIRDVDAAHSFAIGVQRFYWDLYQRDSLDDAGAFIYSVALDYDVYYQNAAWNGQMIVYGPGFAVDDIAGHELTHGVTQFSSNLFYFYQSGAINESLSDLWGEFYDQTNGIGNDTDSARWLIGEDTPIGAFRNMKNPPQYQQPDKMTSAYYYVGLNDNGGVHVNSGVNNKAISLMVDGGAFNNQTVTGIGWEKTAAVYYYAQTHLLTSGSEYADLYNYLYQGCQALVGGSEGITNDDCAQIRRASNAVQMNQQPRAGFQNEAPECPSGTTRNPASLFFDDLENGNGNWTFGARIGNPHWSVAPGPVNLQYAASGKYSLFGNDYDESISEYYQTSDTFAAMTDGVAVPALDTPMLRFKHAYLFEYGYIGTTRYYIDGGVLEYSIDNGATWKDAKGVFSAGQNYKTTLATISYNSSNPLKGRSAFTGDSHGYVSSRYNLSSLKGKTVKFRWRTGTNNTGYALGWVVDDVEIYTCVAAPATPALSAPASGALVPAGAVAAPRLG